MRRALLALALLAGGAGAGPDVFELACPEHAQYVIVRDLDGDGLDEILAVGGGEVWYWPGAEKGPARDPAARLTLPAGAALFDLGPPGPRQRLIVRTAAGYFALAPDRPPERLPHRSGPGLPRNPANVLWRGFFADFDGDGRADLLDLSVAGYRIDFASGGSRLLPAPVAEQADVEAEALSDRYLARYAVGDWTTGDFDGDGRRDFAVLTPGGIRVYPAGFDPDRAFDLPLEGAGEADLLLADLNGDGRTDALSVRRFEGRATILVADAEKGLRLPHRRRLSLPGDVRDLVLGDFDGDGLPDLALPYTAKPSLQDAVRVLLRGEVLLRVPIFRNRGGQAPFGRLADGRLSLPIRIRLRSDPGGRLRLSGLVVVAHEGDLDGDGRRDLLVTQGPERLAFYRGVPEGFFAGEPSAEIRIPDCSEYEHVAAHAGRLNAGPASDMILHYRGAGRRRDRIVVLLTGKK